jgi:hypothetical protein
MNLPLQFCQGASTSHFYFPCPGDYGLVEGEHYVLYLRLVEVEISIQIEGSDHCSDVQKLFSVIENDCEKMMYKKVTIGAKNTK